MANKDHIFVLGMEAIENIKLIETSDPDIIKLVIRSTERMKDAYLVINNVEYPSFTNVEEPYARTTHGFYIPKAEIEANPHYVLHMTGYGNRTNLLREPGLRCCVALKYDPSIMSTADKEFEQDNSYYKEIASKDMQVADGLTCRHVSCLNKENKPVEFFLLRADPEKIGFEMGVTKDGQPYEEKKLDNDGNVVSTKIMYPISTIEEMASEVGRL